jgi:hypothetical protein
LGRVVFTRKAEPAFDWHQIESRLQDISAASPSSRLPPNLPLEPSASPANDPPVLNDSPVTAPGDPFDMLSLLAAAIPSNRS